MKKHLSIPSLVAGGHSRYRSGMSMSELVCSTFRAAAVVVLAWALGSGYLATVVHAQELMDHPLPDIKAAHILVPSGYSHYCSVTYPSGVWDTQVGDDPCQAIAASHPNEHQGTIQRAGLYDVKHANNGLARCRDKTLAYGRNDGATILSDLKSALKGKSTEGCYIVLSPVVLPIFGSPWEFDLALLCGSESVEVNKANEAIKAYQEHHKLDTKSQDTQQLANDLARAEAALSTCKDRMSQLGKLGKLSKLEGAFSFDALVSPWSVQEFGATQGMVPEDPTGTHACGVDRLGNERQTCLSCPSGDLNCRQPSVSAPRGVAAKEPAYDWGLPVGTFLLAMAPGVVLEAQHRGPVCGSIQEELFIESQVGTGTYAEHFVTAYHHMATGTNTMQQQSPVKMGDPVATVGMSGCAGSVHLDLSVFRTTNLTGARSYTFAADPNPSGSGMNGRQGIIDPFGWAAPQGVDPLAYRFIGKLDPLSTTRAPGITDSGAFSINLWLSGDAAPPTVGPQHTAASAPVAVKVTSEP